MSRATDQLRTWAAELQRLAGEWPRFITTLDDLLPDGYPSRQPGHGEPGGGGGISDPTQSAALRRAPSTTDLAQAETCLRHICELGLATWFAVSERTPSTVQPDPMLNLHIARLALVSCADHWRTCAPTHVLVDGSLEPVEWTFEALGAQVTRLGVIMRMPAPDLRAQVASIRCHGGGAEEWAKPECVNNAVTRDGLCDTCRKRRDRHEVKKVA